MPDERLHVGWRDVWAVVKASAERGLGKPLFLMYLVLAIAGAVAVAVLRLLMKDGAIHLEAQDQGRSYLAQGVLLPLALFDKARTPAERAGPTTTVVARAGFEPATFGL